MTCSSESEAPEVRLPKGTSLPCAEPGVGEKSRDSKKPHSCNFAGCKARFSRPWRLSAHLAVHLGKKPFPCDVEGCDKAYTSNYHLRRHKLTSHSKVNSDRSYQCHYPGCKKTFKCNDNAKKHYRRTHEEKTCKLCGNQFFNYLQLKKHMIIHSNGYVLQCQQCDSKFNHLVDLRRHTRGHWLHTCPVKGCVQSYQRWSELRKHIATHPKDFVCAYCKKGYRNRGFLKSHILRHLSGVKRRPYELKKYTCHLCNAGLLGKASLKRHIKSIHENPKPAKSPSSKKERAPRKDKGIPKRSLAAVLSNIVLPIEIESKLINESTNLSVDAIL